MSVNSSSRGRLIGILVVLVIVALGELAALVLEYQNNFYLRQYVSENLGTTIGATVGFVAVALGAGYIVSRKLGARALGPRVPTFARIGSFIGRHHKLIVVFWILLLIVSLPLSQQLSQVVTSSTSGGTSTTSQSAQAEALMTQQFPHPQANTSAIILLQGNDVTDNATKRFTLDLESSLLAPRVLNSVENVTTVYSVERTFLTQGILVLGPAIYQIDNSTTGLNQLLFGVPESFLGIWLQANTTAFVAYGIPSIFLRNWNFEYNATQNNVSQADAYANATTYASLVSLNSTQAIDPNTAKFAFSFYLSFDQYWASSASNQTLVSDPPARAYQAINSTIQSYPPLPDPVGDNLLRSAPQFIQLNTWNNTSVINRFTNATALPILSSGVPSTQASAFQAYYRVWFLSWNSTFTPPLQGLSLQTRLATAAHQAILSYASLPGLDQQSAQLITSIGNSFSPSNATNPGAIYNFTLNQVQHLGQQMGIRGSLSVSFLDSIHALGSAPTPMQAEALANQTISVGSLSNYPIQLPSAILADFISSNKNAMILTVDFSKSAGAFGGTETDPILKNVVTIRDIISQLKASDGGPLQTYVTGDLATTADSSLGSAADLSRIEPVTIAAILILVGIFFFAVVTPIVPLGSIGLALLTAEGGLYLIGRYIVPIQNTVTTFLFTVMLGVGTDYAIFLMARYREERVEGRDKGQAVLTSVTWSGESIATSASTVIIAFGAMTISTFTLLRSIGASLGFGVLIALLVSLTLIPSIILIAGDRVFWPTSGKRFENYAARAKKRRAERPGYFRKAASLSVKRPALVLALALLVSLPAIYISLTGSTSFDFTAGLTQAESVKGITVLEQNFGAGQIGPTQVLVQLPTTIMVNGNLTKSSAASLENLSLNITSLSNVDKVTGPTRPDGIPVDATNMTSLTREERLAVLGSIGKDNRTAMLTVFFRDEPFTQNSLNTVSQIRNLIKNLQSTDSLLSQDTILVGGASASTLDFANETISQFNTMRIITIVAIFIVLLVVLGSYPLAVIGILSIGLSITWAYAATLLFFNDVLQSGVLFIIPLILFLLLYGIGMDYNIFILTRIREEAQKGKETHQAVVDAVDRTGGIITALALILAGAIGSLLLSSNRLLQGFGFAIGLAVILDAMVVRTYIVPAGMSLLGRRAWWGPKWLRRVRFDKNSEASSSS